LIFRHEARFGPADGEISGHFHPVAALTVRGRGMRRRCFLTDGRRLILPAFGAYAGGLNALDPAIAQLFPDDYDALVVGRDGRAAAVVAAAQARRVARLVMLIRTRASARS